MYMRVQHNYALKKTWRDYVDVSAYTGMEAEHGSNTANLYQMGAGRNLGHFNPNSNIASNFPSFTEKVGREFSGLKNVAL